MQNVAYGNEPNEIAIITTDHGFLIIWLLINLRVFSFGALCLMDIPMMVPGEPKENFKIWQFLTKIVPIQK